MIPMLPLLAALVVGDVRNSERRSFLLPPPPPRPIPTNASVWLKWTPGNPPQTTISNLTTGASMLVTNSDNVVMSGMAMGSTNKFVATNPAGASNTILAVAQPDSPISTISIYSFLVTVPAYSNKTTLVFTSTNLLTWQQIGSIVTTNKSYSFIWTNDFGARYFRSAGQ